MNPPPANPFRLLSGGGRMALGALALVWLWLVLINDLRVEWTVNSQYNYGWAVPFLCGYLILEKTKSSRQKARSGERGAGSGNGLAPSEERTAELKGQISAFQSFSFELLLVLLALLYAPTRLVEEANPSWRLVSWALALEVIGITLLVLRISAFSFQRFRFSSFLFPICYFLVAVPWPTWLEQNLIQGLTRADVGASVEVLGWLGIPAMPQGNVIEVASGAVGIDEACSGIRSFQATLMISLFLGELYRLSFVRRAGLVFGGFALSFLFNLARMVLLVWVAARHGVPAIAAWHDPAGVTILLGCFFGLWALGVMFKKAESRKPKAPSGTRANLQPPISEIQLPAGEKEAGKPNSAGEDPCPVVGGASPANPALVAASGSVSDFPRVSRPASLFLALAIWLALAELAIEGWYRWHEARLPRAVQWTVTWPANNPTFKELTLPARTRQILRYDEGRSAAWEENGTGWQAIFLRWNPGRTALHLAQNHTPEVCMTAAGRTLKVIAQQQWFDAGETPATAPTPTAAGERADPDRTGVRRAEAAATNNLRLPFAVYEIQDTSRPFYVFYCLWDDRAGAQGFETMGLTYRNRLAPVLAGRRNPGQRSLEIAVAGPDTAAAAEAAVHAALPKLIRSK